MASILCLAHYCDTHGPTPLMVTEGLPVGCISCCGDDSLSTRRPSTTTTQSFASENAVEQHRSGRAGSTSSERLNSGDRGDKMSRSDSSAILETPPESPRVAALQGGQFPNTLRRDSSYRKTYDENDKKRAIPCENCALTLPKKTREEAQNKLDTNGPILRTRKPYERIARSMDRQNEPSPPKSTCSSDSEAAGSSKPSHRRSNSRASIPRVGTSSSASSFNSTHSHDHYLDYTSTHEPLAPTSFSIIRQSCLRTLSCETLPPSSHASQFSGLTSPTSSPFINNPFSSLTSSSSTSTSSGGPIFFGDSLAGYTTAYIFRIPDPNARGGRRVYALMALSTHRERLAMSAFSFLSTAFKDLAAWIQDLAESELERAENANSSPRPGAGEGGGAFSGGSSISGHERHTSSFLSGRHRGYDGRFAGMSLRARGLAELVGLPDFFIELHARFVRLLIELSMIIGPA